MFKKLFKTLTQSDEDRFREQIDGAAAKLEVGGSPRLARTLREFGKLKQGLDSRLKEGDSSLLKIDDLGKHAESVCEAAIAQLSELAELENTLPGVLTSRDADRFATYLQKWEVGNQSLMRGYAALDRAISGNGPTLIEESGVDGEKSALDVAAESLLVEVRTAERIRNELGR